MCQRVTEEISVEQLINYIPSELLEKLAIETDVDYEVKKLFGKDMFYLLLYGVLESESLSLRVLEEYYKDTQFRHIAQLSSIHEETDHTSLADRLATMNVDYFKKISHSIFSIYKEHFGQKEFNGFTIHRFDSTLITLSSKLLTFGMVNGKKSSNPDRVRKNQIKFTIGFDGLVTDTAQFYWEQKDLGEDAPLRNAILSVCWNEKDIAVFDRGLKKRKTFAEFTQHNIRFTTRINPTNNYEIIEDLTLEQEPKTKTLQILKDMKVYLFDGTKTKVKVPFRLILAQSLKTGELLYFLTNIMDLPATDITEIYRLRWEIEVFFKFLKQHCNLKHLLSRNHNGIEIVLYVTLIAAMLVYIYKKLNNICSYKIAKIRFVNELKNEIIKQLIILCGGNPSKLKVFNKL